MIFPDFTIGQGDQGVSWAVPITDATGNTIDISGATSVILHYRIQDGSAVAVEVVGSVLGTTPDTEAQYIFQSSDTVAAGIFNAEFLITQASGERLTFPACAGRTKLVFEVFAQP